MVGAGHVDIRDVVDDALGRAGGRMRAVVVGGSAGGMEALIAILSPLPAGYPLPVVVAHHLHRTDEGRFAEHLGRKISMRVAEAGDKMRAEPGRVHVAPANYHLLVERDGSLSLTVDPRVSFARPSIDVLFESAARAWGEGLAGVILSGANDDGAEGMRAIREHGGLCIAQDPETAQSRPMPTAAIEAASIEIVLTPERIAELLGAMAGLDEAPDGDGAAAEEEGR